MLPVMQADPMWAAIVSLAILRILAPFSPASGQRVGQRVRKSLPIDLFPVHSRTIPCSPELIPCSVA
jgi:hypothetical protein